MKRFFSKCAALLCTAAAACRILAAPVCAAEEKDNTKMPSGKPVYWLERQLDTMFLKESGVSKKMFPSCAIFIFQGDDVKTEAYYGETDVKNHVKNDENSVYDWGSISKTMIWVSALQLWEQGKLDLEQDIRTYLPDNFLQKLQFDTPITMLDLMNHSGGWGETTYQIATRHADRIRPLAQFLQDTEPVQSFRPGEVTAYSNWGSSLAAYVVERVAGQDYCDYIHEHIFAPLGMEHTSIAPDHSDNPWVKERRAALQCYSISGILSMRGVGPQDDFIEAYPCGAAVGTLRDIGTYAQALADDSAPLFRNPETQEFLFTPSKHIGNSNVPYIAHGFFINHFANDIFWHNGATAGCSSVMMIDRDSDFGYVALTNQRGDPCLENEVPEMIFGERSLQNDPDYDYNTEKRARLNGTYVSSRAWFHGLLKIVTPFFMSVQIDDQTYDLGDQLYLSPDKNAIFAKSEISDGRTKLELGGEDYLNDSHYLLEIVLFTAYLCSAVIAFYALKSKRVLRKSGKYAASLSNAVVSAAQLFQILSVVLIAVILSFNWGVPKTIGAVIGSAQLLCGVLSLAAICASVLHLLRADGNRKQICCAVGSILCSGIAVCTILFFELYRFWYC